MSYANLLQPALGRLRSIFFGRKITDSDIADGQLVDTGVQRAIDEIINCFGDQPITLDNGPIQIQNNTLGPVFQILQNGGVGDGGVVIEIINNVTNTTENITNDNITNVTNETINETGTGMSGTITAQFVADASPTITVTGCGVSINMNLTMKTLTINVVNGLIQSASVA